MSYFSPGKITQRYACFISGQREVDVKTEKGVSPFSAQIPLFAQPNFGSWLEIELGGQLNLARGIGAHNVPKRGAADVSVDSGGAEKLGVVRNVK